jgi:hypothetical protein
MSEFGPLTEQYRRRGFVLLKEAALTGKVLEHFHGVLREAVKVRGTAFTHLKKSSDTAAKASVSKDPLAEKIVARMKKIKEERAWKRAQKRLGDLSIPKPTSGDVFDVAQKVAAQLVVNQSAPNVQNDPNLLKIFNDCKINAWMTNEDLETFLKGHLRSRLSTYVREIAGISDPFLFADRPLMRTSYSRPMMYQMVAPMVGIGAEALTQRSACGIWIFADNCTSMRCPVYSFARDGVHEMVEAHYPKVSAKAFNMDFSPVDSHIPHWIGQFPFLKEFDTEEVRVEAGDVILMNPFHFYGMGCNFSSTPHFSYQLLIGDRNELPSRIPPTWIRKWRGTAAAIDFRYETLFPRF